MTTTGNTLTAKAHLLAEEFKSLFLNKKKWVAESIESNKKLFDISSGETVFIPADTIASACSDREKLLFLNENGRVFFVFDSDTGVLWLLKHAYSSVSPENVYSIINKLDQGGFGWDVVSVVKIPEPILSLAGIGNRVFFNSAKYSSKSPRQRILKYDVCELKDGSAKALGHRVNAGLVLSTSYFKDKALPELLKYLSPLVEGCRVFEGSFVKSSSFIDSVSVDDLLCFLLSKRVRLVSGNGKRAGYIIPSEFKVDTYMSSIDYTPCRLPKLDKTQLTDPEQGLWELWDGSNSKLPDSEFIARNPSQDIKNQAIAIDFGTSSTVVAMLNESGGRELLRIGVRDFFQPIEAKHFENPTVLEFLDYAAFSDIWRNQAYRPELNWDWVRASHEAQASYRDNPGNTHVLASILPKLKQWALRSNDTYQLTLTGRKGKEIKIPHHTERNPLRGQELQVSVDDPLDPIELYAWYLGMTINWRGRGIFLKYYLSFPVKYSREVRERMLASFRRGLQRSLPYSLIQHYPEVLNEFSVAGLASEPAAYAAAAMEYLGIEPTDEGVPYAVFDFGGGTSDFDFGVLRWATEEEEGRGYERVFEQLATSGDNVLGGENLLEQLVYASFQNNLDELRKKKVQFTLPLETRPFPGSETFLAASQAAQTNSVMLSAKLRDFMEGEDVTLSSQIKLDLLDVNGSKQSCELALDAEQLDELLKQRIIAGVRSFMHQLKRVLNQFPVNQSIHVLLAGNGSRSRHLQILTDQKGEAWQQLCEEVFGGHCPDIKIYPAIESDENEPFAPTGKTGVALGLLALTPGKGVMLRCLTEETDGQAPFGWYVGRMRRGKFTPAIEPGQSYADWVEVGPLQEGHIDLYSTSSPRAMTEMKAGDAELRMRSLHFVGASEGSKLFVRCTGPNSIELQAGESANENSESIQALNFV